MLSKWAGASRLLLTLLSSSLALAACSGEIAAPAGTADWPSCPDCVLSPDGGIVLPGKGAPGKGAAPLPSPGAEPVVGEEPKPSAGEATTPDGVGWTTRFPKLSNRQWDKTVQALFYLDAPPGLAAEFTQEPQDKAYESMAAAELTIAGDAWTRYQTAAEKLASQIVADAAKLAKITPSGTFADAKAKGAAFISSFGARAFRRPLTADEKSAYATLFAAGSGTDPYQAGVRLVLSAMLQSPHFLYRLESSDKTDDKRKVWLSGYEVATRLSYAFWNSMPSDELLAAAGKGELDTKEGIAGWASKMLDDPRASDMLLSFHEQTFEVSTFGTQDKDAALKFDSDVLAPVLREEARKFFEHVVVKNGGGIEDILTATTAFVNEDTAPFYEVTGITGKALQPVELNPDQRAGLLSQLGFLTKNATRTTSDPVHRGLAIIRKVLCDEPEPPPMMFDLPSPKPGLTTREVYEEATKCGGACHTNLINPPGFAFEAFDTLGRYRTMEGEKPIDATGTIDVRVGYTHAEKKSTPPAKVTFNGPVELMTQLATQPRVHECYSRHWLEFVLGREVDPVERGAWEVLRDSSLQEGSAKALLLKLVQLDTFRSRVSEAP